MHYQNETKSQSQSRRSKPFQLTLLCTALFLTGCQSFSGITKVPLNQPEVRPNAQQVQNKRTQVNQNKPVKTLTEVNVAPEPVLPANAWEFILANPGIDYSMNRRIKAQKDWYLQHPAFLSQVLARSEPFLGYVIDEADKRGLPRALALLPIVESRYNPHAKSKAGAVGTWQFIPSTAAHFGLRMNWWYDGRRDIVTSTDAALTYLEQLHKRFGDDWLLALASYNAGGGNVNKAIRRNENRGRPTDYWHLPLPRETTEYVPRLLALLEIIQEPEKYNVNLPQIPVEAKVTAVDTVDQIDVAQLAKLAGLSEKEFRTLNPGLRRWASDPQGQYKVLLPTDKAPAFIAALRSLPKEQRTTWRRHTVQPGDTISQIANAHNLPTSEFKRINQLNSSFIRVGQKLLVPQNVQTLASAGSSTAKIQKTSNSPSKLVTSNNGQAVTLLPKSVDHTVQAGDTLWDLSKQYKTSVRLIAAENNLSTRKPLKVGQVLTVTLSDGVHTQRVSYKVQAGDSLYGIAKRFKVSIGDIASWNSIDKSNHIKPGQQLTLFLNNES